MLREQHLKNRIYDILFFINISKQTETTVHIYSSTKQEYKIYEHFCTNLVSYFSFIKKVAEIRNF